MHDNIPPFAGDISEDDADIEAINYFPSDEEEDDDVANVVEAIADHWNIDSDHSYSAPFFGSSLDDAAVTFYQNSAMALCCAMNPLLPVAATGFHNTCVFVWHIVFGEQLYVNSDHIGGVVEAHFSHDGVLLATKDICNLIIVHELQENGPNGFWTFSKVWEYVMDSATWIGWQSANVLMAGDFDGYVKLWRLPYGDCTILPSGGARSVIGEMSSDGKVLFTTYANALIRMWDYKNNAYTLLGEIKASLPASLHSNILSIAYANESPLYVLRGNDNQLVFWTNDGPEKTVQTDGIVECIAFPPTSEQKVLAAATSYGQIAIWNYEIGTMRAICERPESGVKILKWLSKNTLMVASRQGNLFIFNATTGEFKFMLCGHCASICDVNYYPNIHALLTASEDGSSKLFQLPPLED